MSFFYFITSCLIYYIRQLVINKKKKLKFCIVFFLYYLEYVGMNYKEEYNIAKIANGAFSSVFIVPSKDKSVIIKKLKNIDKPKQFILLRNEIYINMILKQAEKNKHKEGLDNVSIIDSYYGEILDNEVKEKSRNILKLRLNLESQDLLGINNDLSCNLLIFNYTPSITLLDFINNIKYKNLKNFSNKKLLIDILSGLNFIHQLGICHHDLKPENIIIELSSDKYNKAKLIDFGLSTSTKFKNSNGEDYNNNQCVFTGGTRQYMGPEKLLLFNSNQNYDGYLSDIWSIGIIYFYTCFRVLPFKLANNECKYYNIFKQNQQVNSCFINLEELNEELNKLIQVLNLKGKFNPSSKDLIPLNLMIQINPKKRYNASSLINFINLENKDTPIKKTICSKYTGSYLGKRKISFNDS